MAAAAAPYASGISGIPCSILLGMLASNAAAATGNPATRQALARLQPGLAVCTKGVLQAGIVCVVGNCPQGERRGRVSGVLSASWPLLTQEDPENEVMLLLMWSVTQMSLLTHVSMLKWAPVPLAVIGKGGGP
eukprot:3529269-Pyramimonas_sp.AAC.1